MDCTSFQNSATPTSEVNDWLKLAVPAAVAVTVFFLGILVTWLKSNLERRKDSRNLRSTLITWVKYMDSGVKTLASSCNDFASRVAGTNEIHPEKIKFNFMHASKVSNIEVTKTIKAFVTNSTGDAGQKSQNYYKLISGLEYLAKIEDEIKAKYDEHYSYTLKLLDEWNESFVAFDTAQRALVTDVLEKPESRVALEKELSGIITNWLAVNKKDGQNINVTYEILLTPFEEKIITYIDKSGSKENSVSNVLSGVQDLVIVYRQWTASKEAYSLIFAEYDQKLQKVYKQTSDAATYFETATTIKLLCN
jgi:hypothetical protein